MHRRVYKPWANTTRRTQPSTLGPSPAHTEICQFKVSLPTSPPPTLQLVGGGVHACLDAGADCKGQKSEVVVSSHYVGLWD